MIRFLVVLLLTLGVPAQAGFYGGFVTNGSSTGGGGGGGGGTTVSNFTLVNDTATLNPANTFAPFGREHFKDGDIPAGTDPELWENGQASATDCSFGMPAYWNSGALRDISYACRLKGSVSGSGQLSGAVWKSSSGKHCGDANTGGTGVNCTNNRTLAEVYALNGEITVNRAGGGSPLANWNLSAQRKAYLANDTNNYRQTVLMDGKAGKLWKISVKVTNTAGGSWLDRLVYDFYIWAGTDENGALAGFRFGGMLRQPFYNGTGAANDTCYAVDGDITFQTVGPGGSGTATIHTPFPFTSKNYNVTGGVVSTTTAHGYYMGAGTYGNVLPARFTGSVPTTSPQINTTDLYQIIAPDNTNVIAIYQGPTGPQSTAGYQQIIFSGTSGPFTVVPVGYEICRGTKIPFYTTDAKFFYIQGQGSKAALATSADNTLRTKPDRDYWNSTKAFVGYIRSTTFHATITGASGNTANLVVSSIDGGEQYLYVGQTISGSGVTTNSSITGAPHTGTPGQTGTYTITCPTSCANVGSSTAMTATMEGTANGGQVPDVDVPSDWNPLNFYEANQWAQNPGDHDDLGPRTKWQAQHFYNLTANSEKAVRITGLASSLLPYDTKDVTTDTLINLTPTAYTGVGSPAYGVQWGETGTSGCPGYGFPSFCNGFAGPSALSSKSAAVAFSQADTSHRPSLACPAFMYIGEPQYLDLCLEGGWGAVVSAQVDVRAAPMPATGVMAYGMVGYYYSEIEGHQEARRQGWAQRELYDAAYSCPYNPASTSFKYDGTETCHMIRQAARNDTQYLTQTMDPANNYFGSFTSYITGPAKAWVSGGHYNPPGVTGPGFHYSMTYGLISYESFFSRTPALAHAALSGEDANAVTFLGVMKDRWNFMETTYGAYHTYNVSDYPGKCTPDGTCSYYNSTTDLFTADEDWGYKIWENTWAGIFSWTNGTTAANRFTFDFSCGAPHCQIQNGARPGNQDAIRFMQDDDTPGGLNRNTTYYLQNVTESPTNVFTFKLSTDLAGTNLVQATNSGSYNPAEFHGYPGYRLRNPPGPDTGYAATYPEAYVWFSCNGAAAAKQAGVDTSNWLLDCHRRLRAQDSNWANGNNVLFGNQKPRPQYLQKASP